MIKQLNKANKFMESKTMSVIDWILAIGILAYGIYLYSTSGANFNSVATIAVGLLSLVLAYIKPAQIIKRKLDSVIQRKQMGK